MVVAIVHRRVRSLHAIHHAVTVSTTDTFSYTL